MVEPPYPSGSPRANGAMGLGRSGDAAGGANYEGAIYGSLLAASTIVGTAAAGTDDVQSAQLLAALLATSAVFWMMHVYVRVVAVELPLHERWFDAVLRGSGHELPILLSVIPPAAAVVLTIVLDEPADLVGWWAIWVAVGGMVLWTAQSLRQARAGRGLTVLSLAVSVALGLVLVGLKAALGH